MTFGEKFKAERLRRRMTQQQVADALDINLRMITRYEKGESFPRTRESYRRIAELFGCNINYFLAEDDDFDVSDKGQYSEDSRRDAQQLINSMSGLFAGGDLTESDKDAVMQALEKIYWDSRRRYHRMNASDAKKSDGGQE